MKPSAAASAPPLEVKTERDTAIALESGKQHEVVRVLYRRPPTRRWTRFLLVPDAGQTIEALEDRANEAAILHAMRCEAVTAATTWSYRLRLAWERRKLAVSETWLRLRGVKGDMP